MRRNRETQKELKIQALSNLYEGRIRRSRLMVTNPKKSKFYFLSTLIFNIAKAETESLKDYSLSEYLTIKRINPEFD
jgi:hypothetical protein